jgi:hypothetical protein
MSSFLDEEGQYEDEKEDQAIKGKPCERMGRKPHKEKKKEVAKKRDRTRLATSY